MKGLLCLLALCVSLTMCHADCIDPNDGSSHATGSRWDSPKECMRCTCYANSAIGCVDMFGGASYKEGCTTVYDKKTCTTKYVQDNDPTKPC